MAKVKKDIVILKHTGKIHMVRDCMTEKDNIITIHDGQSRPTYANSPYHNQFQGTFFNDGNYELVKGVQIEEELLKRQQYIQYQYVDGEIKRIDVCGTAGYARSILDLKEEVEALKKQA